MDTMLALSEKYNTLGVSCNQVGTPTYTMDLARLLVDMVETEKCGLNKAVRPVNCRLDKPKQL